MSVDKIYPGGSDTGLQHNLQKRLNVISGLLELREKRMLGCGCGHGSYLLGFLAEGGDTYGIEYSDEKVREFQAKYPYLARCMDKEKALVLL